jgi:hypothetical protein
MYPLITEHSMLRDADNYVKYVTAIYTNGDNKECNRNIKGGV